MKMQDPMMLLFVLFVQNNKIISYHTVFEHHLATLSYIFSSLSFALASKITQAVYCNLHYASCFPLASEVPVLMSLLVLLTLIQTIMI